MNKILAFLAAITKPVIELANNILDPEKKRLRKMFELEKQIEQTQALVCWLEIMVKKTRKKDVKERYCTRLAVAILTLSGMRDQLAKYKR